MVSGSGTILESIINAGLDVTLVASDRACRGLEVARGAGIEALLVERADYGGFSAGFDREGYSRALAQVLVKYRIDLVAMAGFGTIMTGVFHEAFPGRVLNTHPSLLPDFKGWHAVAQALEAQVAESGCTVHIATEELDNGPVLAQRRVPVYDQDDEASLHERIKDVERQLYPLVLTRVMAALDHGEEPISVAGTLEEN
ncbi:MAG: phosphoribosylglycinamide formyltransferase [Acidimicrobiales bacterium]